MIGRLIARAFVTVAMLLGLFSPAHATLIGVTGTVDYYYPDNATVYPGSTETPSVFVIGAGIELVINVEGILAISLDITDDTVLIHYDKLTSYFSQWTNVAFSGLILNLQLPGGSGIASVNVTPQPYMPDFNNTNVVVFDSNTIGFNWSGLRYDPNNPQNDGDGLAVLVKLDIQEIPEPQTILMIVLALAGISGLTWARRYSAARAFGIS